MQQRPNRRHALGLLGGFTASGLLPGLAAAASPQCRSVTPEPKTLPRFRGASLGELARAKGLQLGLQTQISANRDAGDGIYSEAYLNLLFSEQPDFIAFGNQFLFSTVCPDPPIGGHLMTTVEKYNIANSWYSLDDAAPKFMAKHIGARADALIWENGDVRQSWLKKIPRGSSPDRDKNPDLDWNLRWMEDYIRLAFTKINALNLKDPGFFRAVSLVNEPLDYWGRGHRATGLSRWCDVPGGHPDRRGAWRHRLYPRCLYACRPAAWHRTKSAETDPQ